MNTLLLYLFLSINPTILTLEATTVNCDNSVIYHAFYQNYYIVMIEGWNGNGLIVYNVPDNPKERFMLDFCSDLRMEFPTHIELEVTYKKIKARRNRMVARRVTIINDGKIVLAFDKLQVRDTLKVY